GYAVLKDVYKTIVFELAKYRNSLSETPVIPERVITRPPSAELRPDQKDSDSLPEYSELDAILHCLIEENMSVLETVAKKHNVDTVAKVAKLIAISEHKRFQLPPIVKLSSATLGIDRIYPIASKLTY
ncbi:MAG: NAD+ synthase, partial [Rikenellaceae bacterium]